ncbi:MAG TPA: hypothetical protein VLI90_17805 [Tepidisphaeraceae bacterium]|nr:hypothetical protein [Tepidisphaeraceae bacterium]
MKRRLFNVLAAVSLVLCVATAAACILSYQRLDAIGSFEDHSPIVAQAKGRLLIGFGSLLKPNEHHRVERSNDVQIGTLAWGYVFGDMLETAHGFAGFWFAISRPLGAQDKRNWCLIVPHWACFVATAILPLTAYAGWRRTARWQRKGRCPRCGYDLRATPQRCPECGTAVKPAA